MSDWISKAAKKNKIIKERKNLGLERKRQAEEAARARSQAWLKANNTEIEAVFRKIESETQRAKEASLHLSSSRVYNGVSVREYNNEGACRHFAVWAESENRKFIAVFQLGNRELRRREYNIDGITETKILSWIRWVATGKRSLWSFLG